MRRFAPLLPSLTLGAGSFLLAVTVAIATLPAAARAQAGTIAGTYTFDRAGSDNVDKAIATAVKDMNFVTRPIARGRLQKTNQPYQQVTIGTSGANTVVTIDKLPARQAPSDGTPVNWTRPADGDKLKLSMQWDSTRLVETLKAEDGQRVNAYSLSPDGATLTMNVTITSPRLPKPVTYRLAYKKA
jgi:hypothetical protein